MNIKYPRKIQIKEDCTSNTNERMLTFICQKPAIPLQNIMAMEGITEDDALSIIDNLENVYEVRYEFHPRREPVAA